MPIIALIIVRAVVELLFLAYASRLSKGWLYGYIVTNLLLITVLGGKMVTVGNFTTNVGNVFYASVFLATYLLLEYHGTAAAYRSVRIAAAMVFLFVLMIHVTLAMTGTFAQREFNEALQTALQPTARVALASILGFILAQHINIWIYDMLKRRAKMKFFWLRVNISNALAQMVDSFVFFLVVFLGTTSMSAVWSVMLLGYGMKIIFVAVGAFALQWQVRRRVR